MNCKPGDLAVIVRSLCGNEGRFVEVVNGDVYELPGDLGLSEFAPLWRIRPLGELVSSWGVNRAESAFPDAWLRPIRPGDISDEEVRDLYAPKLPEVA